MPITTTKPLVKDGVTYPFLFVHSLIVSTRIENGNMITSVVTNLAPYRELPGSGLDYPIDANGQPDGMKAIIISDAFVRAASDPAVAQSMGYILGAIDSYVQAKEL